MESKIQKLDYVLDLVVAKKSIITANDLYNSGFYNSNDQMESDFLEMVLEFKRLGVADVVNYGKGLRKNEFTDGFKKDGGFASHYANEQIQKTKETERQDLKDKIDTLNLSALQHKETIREQEDRIRDLTEQLTLINLIKAYKWYITFIASIGIAIGYFLS